MTEEFIKMSTNILPSTDYANILSSENHSSISHENPDLCTENSELIVHHPR